MLGKMKLIKIYVMELEKEWEIIETQRGMKNKHNLWLEELKRLTKELDELLTNKEGGIIYSHKQGFQKGMKWRGNESE